VQDDFQVVDHQVEDHADFRPARQQAEPRRRIRRDPQRLHVEGFLLGLVDDLEHRIEPLDVPDLQDDAAPLGQFDQLLGFLRAGRDGLFHQDVLALFDDHAGHRAVLVRRHDDVQRLGRVGQLFHRLERRRVVALGDLLRALLVGVVHAHQFHVGHFGINARVPLP